MSNIVVRLHGQRFGSLVVVRRTGKRTSRGVYWLCRCDCGKRTSVPTSDLRIGNTRSCGCGQKAAAAKSCRARTKHGSYGVRLYNIWHGMRLRCHHPKNISYPRYGGRGISICDEWNEFSIFKAWAISHGYADGLSIDRIDFDGDYEPCNCRWIPLKDQAGNRSTTRKITYDGRTQSSAAWGRERGINPNSIRYRIHAGWPMAAVLGYE